jgi:hypothetical protein
MAGFKAHMAFGMLTGAAWAAVAIALSLITLWIAPIVFFAGFIGAFLPDLDSDTGKPLRILLLCTGAAGAAMAGLYLLETGQTELKLFAVYTIPAAILAMLVTLTILNNFDLDAPMKMATSLAVGIGYLSHLILDELNSVVNLKGIPFVPNKASGSALKFYSNNHIVTLGVYFLVIFLGYSSFGLITDFFDAIF